MGGRHARALRLGAAALGAILALSACRSPSPTERPPQRSVRTDAFALWPEETPTEAAQAARRLAAGRDPWRGDPVATALAFAREVLGWEAAAAGSAREQPGGLTVVEVSREPGGPSVSVRLSRLVADRWWSVYNAWGSPEHDPSVAVRGSRVTVRFAMEDAASALVVVEFGEVRRSAIVRRPGPVRLDLGAVPAEPGFFLVLLRDRAGRVFDAVSSPLAPGPTAAG